MRRRQVLAGAAGALLVLPGCLADPPTPAETPVSSPNVLIEFEWLPDRPAYRVTFRRGNRLTTANTGGLYVIADDVADEVGRTVWIESRPDDREADEPTTSVGEYPLTPGPDTTLVQPVPEPATVRVVWRSPDFDQSVSVAVWDLRDQPAWTPTPTREGAARVDATDATSAGGSATDASDSIGRADR